MNSNIDNWLCVKKLSVNVSKSFFSIFFNMKNSFIPITRIRGENLLMMIQTKFIYGIIDDNISFSDHLNLPCKKISRSIGAIKNVADYLPQTSLRSLYFTIVHPHVIYAIG